MKNLFMALSLFIAVSIAGTHSAQAQTKKTTTAQQLTDVLGQAAVQGGLINVGNLSVDVSNVTVQDLVTVQSVLNNANIEILRNSLNNNETLKNISITLTNLLRNAKILNQNQVVVGLLSDQGSLKFVTANSKAFNM